MTNNPTAVALRMATTHDTSGNPRRIYAISTDFKPGQYGNAGWNRRTIYVEEGYNGTDSLRAGLEYLGVAIDQCADLGTFIVTPGEYRDTTKMSDYFPGPEAVRQAAKQEVTQ